MKYVQKPVMVDDYNQNMGGVDLCDQLLNYYALSRKTKKWWKRTQTHLPVYVLFPYML